MKNQLNNLQISFLLFGVIVGYGILGLPKNLAEVAGTGGWFSLVLSTIIAILITYMFVYLGLKYENKTLDEYSKLLTGKFLTYFILLLYSIYFFLFFTYINRIMCEVIKLTILFNTPVWALMLLVLIVAYYSISRGINGIANFFELYGMIIIGIGLIVFLLIFTQGESINLKPFFIRKDIKKYFKAIAIVIPFLGMEILTFIPINKKVNKNIFKYQFIMLIIIGFFYIFEYESCLAVIGEEDIIHYKNTLIAVVRRVDLRFLEFLERIDGIVISMWIMAAFCTIVITAYGSIYFMDKIAKKINAKIIGLILIILSFLVGLIPETFSEVEKILEFTSYIGLIVAIIIPLILIILSMVKKYD